MVVRALTVDDVDTYRTIRLESLQADPDAFGSTFEREVGFDEDEWRERLTGAHGLSATAFIDEDHAGRPVGTVTVLCSLPDSSEARLVAMWVRASHRGQGVGGRLIATAVAHARAQGADAIELAVKRDNGGAIALYERHGFVQSGSVVDAEDSCCIGELEMRLLL